MEEATTTKINIYAVEGDLMKMCMSKCVVLGSFFFFFTYSQYSIHWHFLSVNIVQKQKQNKKKTIIVAMLLGGVCSKVHHIVRAHFNRTKEKKISFYMQFESAFFPLTETKSDKKVRTQR